MNTEIEKTDNIPSTSTLAKQGMIAVACTAGGLLLLILQTVARLPVLGIIAGGVACVIGIISLLSKDPADKKAGAVIGGAGVLIMVSKTKLLGPIAGTLIGIGAVGLLVMGIWNGIKFLKGLRKRSR
ncbi:MAG TPA: hypothetical protein DEQ14_11825 [Treponema sp.]|nr:hypothetical protein [Treponema sp.]